MTATALLFQLIAAPAEVEMFVITTGAVAALIAMGADRATVALVTAMLVTPLWQSGAAGAGCTAARTLAGGDAAAMLNGTAAASTDALAAVISRPARRCVGR